MDHDEVAAILNFYSARDEQNGDGLDYFYTPYSSQKGSGVGSFLAGVSRPLIPIIRRGVQYLTPHLLRILRQIAGDFSENPTLSSLQSSLRTHGVNTLENVTSDAISRMRGGRLRMVKRSISTRALPKSSLTSANLRKKRATVRSTSTKRRPGIRKIIKRRVVNRKTSVKRETLKKKKKSTAIEYPFFK